MSVKCKTCNWISCGEINKYALLILIAIILHIALNYVILESKFSYYPIIDSIIYQIISSLGSFLSFILFIIYTIRNRRKNKKTNLPFIKKYNKNEISCKKKILWILLVSIIAFIAIFFDSLITINEINNSLNLFGFFFIFLSAFSLWLLKNKLYKHHYISMAIMIVLDLLNNIIYGTSFIENQMENKFSYLIIICLELFYSLSLVLYKYLMLIKYIKTYEILFFEGLFFSVLSITILIILIKIGYINDFWEYYENIDQKEIIIFISLALICFFISLINLIIIDIFSPFHILLTELIPKNMYYIFNPKNTADLIINIVFTILELFIIFVFVEFIELNFLGLSKMTKRNIESRAKIEFMEDDINDINYGKKIVLDEYGLELEFKNEQTPGENNASED